MNDKIDLAVLPAAGLLNEMITQNKTPFFISLREQDLPTVEQLNDIGRGPNRSNALVVLIYVTASGSRLLVNDFRAITPRN